MNDRSKLKHPTDYQMNPTLTFLVINHMKLMKKMSTTKIQKKYLCKSRPGHGLIIFAKKNNKKEYNYESTQRQPYKVGVPPFMLSSNISISTSHCWVEKIGNRTPSEN